MKIADLGKLNKLEKELIEEALKTIKNPNVSWDYYLINASSSGYDKFEYFVTCFKTGYLIILKNGQLYYSLTESSYNWDCMEDYILFLGYYEIVDETFRQLTETYHKSRILG